MGREVRRVPADWQHPKNESGHYIPLFDDFNKNVEDWDKGYAKWQEGLRDDFKGGWQPIDSELVGTSFEDYTGSRPDPAHYMPDWPAEQRTHYRMYETTTEGTPISPVMASPEELAEWLVHNQVSAFADSTASYAAWLRVCRGGFAPSAISTNGQLVSGVEALADN